LPSRQKLLGWIETRGTENFVGAFIGEEAISRAPATQRCSSADEARRWIEDEAEAVGLSVNWLTNSPSR
jgi:hypothetical protein